MSAKYNEFRSKTQFMTQILYISILIFSLAALLYTDWKKRLFLFGKYASKYQMVLFATVLIFLVVDLFGIHLDIFATNPKYVIGFFLTENIPLEEVLFLFLATISAFYIQLFVKK